MTPPIVTIAVLPREKFSYSATSLRSLLVSTEQSFDLIYVDGASPPKVRREVDAVLAEVPHVLCRTDRFLGPFEAMEVALREAKTPYLVFADNDVHFRRGWLEALLSCAVENAADVVTPLILIGDEHSHAIHVAGGLSHIATDGGVRRIRHHQRLEHQDQHDSTVSLRRERTELVESHCLLARTEIMRALGPLDPAVGHATNVEELSLGLARVDASVWFEPRAEVVYLFEKGMRLDRHDVALLNHVWSEKWIDSDLAKQAQRHHLDNLTGTRRRVRWWFGDHRRVWLWPVERRTVVLGRRLGAAWLGRALWKLVESTEVGANRITVLWSAVFDARCRPSPVSTMCDDGVVRASSASSE